MGGLRKLAPLLIWLGSALTVASALAMVMLAAALVLPRQWLQPPLARDARGQVRLAASSAPGAEVLTAVPAREASAQAGSSYRLAAGVPRLYYLWIPKLGLYAPVVAMSARTYTLGAQTVAQLDVPDAFAAGWSVDSAAPGQPGNTVLTGHNNAFGAVFKDLWYLAAGDEIVVQGAAIDYRYTVSEIVFFEEQNRPLGERLENARWMLPTADDRLTLLTCWPYYSNTHRLVVVALPQR